MLFLDNYSYLEHRVLNQEIDEIEDNIDYYKSEIKKDSASIKHLKNNDRVEKFAREKYYMKRENEDIYIIEYEDDNKTEKTNSNN
jgi:cell division protein FtsB